MVGRRGLASPIMVGMVVCATEGLATVGCMAYV